MSKSTQPRNPDQVRRTNRPSPDNEVIQDRLRALLTPAVFRQLAYYRSLKLRNRLLGLPVMVAAVLMLLWRQVPSVNELAKLLCREDLLMVFRSLYYFIQAYSKGEATDPVKYLAASENRDLGVVKRIRKKPPEALAPSALSLAGA